MPPRGRRPARTTRINDASERDADAGDHRAGDKHGVILRLRHEQDTQHQHAQAGKQHGAGADAIDYETGERLANAGDNKEHRHGESQFGVGQVERILQPRKQGGENELGKMRHAMRHADEADDLRILAEIGGNCCCHGNSLVSIFFWTTSKEATRGKV